jgi:predicted transposase/invertase (TIGR01784 family)
MPIIGINPTVDFAFKLRLGSPEHSRVTIHFLNAILGDKLKITQVEIRNPYNGRNYKDEKWVILDILAIDEHGRRLNIEMQTTLPAGLRQRLAFYDARLYVDQMGTGEQYTQLRPAIVICVLTAPLFPDASDLHLGFRMRDASGRVLTDDLQIHLLQLTNLQVTRENLARATAAERWAFFLLNAGTMEPDELRELFPEPEFVEAMGVLEVIKKTPEQRDEYISRMKFQLDEAARLQYAREEGEKSGEERGEERGRREGRQEGRQEGELIGRIVVYQELLGLTQPTRGELSEYEASQLIELANDLQLHLRTRGR